MKSIEITTNLNEAGAVSLQQKYNKIIADIIISKVSELPEPLQGPVLEAITQCIINGEVDVYSE